MADQEFLTSFAVEIDESGASRLQQVLEENRDLAEEVASAFEAATEAIREYTGRRPWAGTILPGKATGTMAAGQWFLSIWDHSSSELLVNMIPLICSYGEPNDLLLPFRHLRGGQGLGSLFCLGGDGRTGDEGPWGREPDGVYGPMDGQDGMRKRRLCGGDGVILLFWPLPAAGSSAAIVAGILMVIVIIIRLDRLNNSAVDHLKFIQIQFFYGQFFLLVFHLYSPFCCKAAVLFSFSYFYTRADTGMEAADANGLMKGTLRTTDYPGACPSRRAANPFICFRVLLPLLRSASLPLPRGQ